jgi:hypothetical protein
MSLSKDQDTSGVAHTHSRLAILSTAIPLSPITSVKQHAVLNYFGPVHSPILSSAVKFIAAHTDASEEPIMETLESFIGISEADCVGKAEQKNCCWFTIRITQPNDSFKVPRWHQDGRMFDCDIKMRGVPRSKYALTLLGPPTLLLSQSQHIFETLQQGEKEFFWWRGTGKKVSEEEQDIADEGLRRWLAERFVKEKMVMVGEGKVVRFSWGWEDSPVHSEPDLDVEDGRVFMTVLFGSEGELRRMCELRGEVWGVVDV